ncbi:helix-turn-helix transcriptional regulator [Altererythrobacter sp. H2]|uniref:helix-turn-helix transcriptional regulator n=1 Tax=Altererythrobacter sp. H2 TaxID=3108391 RepID=UPI003A5D04EA
MQPQFLRVNEFCDRYAVSRATFYRLVSRGEIAVCKVGSATRVRASDAETWAQSLTDSPSNDIA